jgi:hypothetical protein
MIWNMAGCYLNLPCQIAPGLHVHPGPISDSVEIGVSQLGGYVCCSISSAGTLWGPEEAGPNPIRLDDTGIHYRGS